MSAKARAGGLAHLADDREVEQLVDEVRIVVIESAGRVAVARLEAENGRGTRYRDFLLLRVEGAWRIASKVFFAPSRA